MKRFVWMLLALTICLGAAAQPGAMPENVISTARANYPIMYGGPTRAEGRSYYGHWNFMPTARIMWDFFSHYRRDPETKKLIYNP